MATNFDVKVDVKVGVKVDVKVGDTVWKLSDPSISGKVDSLVDNGNIGNKFRVNISGSWILFNNNEITNNPNKIIGMLINKVKLGEESLNEVRENYWRVHQEVLQLRKVVN